MSDGYLFNRKHYGDWGGSIEVLSLSSGTIPMVKCSFKAQNQIWIQRIHIHISTALAGVTWTVQDSTGVTVLGPISAAVAPTQDPIAAEYDFGPKGLAITPGADLQLVLSAPGASGDVTWDAYQRLRTDVPALP